MSNQNNLIDELIQEVEKELEETTTSADAGAYNTPNAFSDNGSKDKKRKKKISTQLGMKLVGNVNEGILQDREKQLKNLKQGALVKGGGYGPFKKTGRDTFVSPKGKKYNSSALIKFIGTFSDFKIDEAYKGNSSDFKTDIVNALDNIGISPKAIKKISKKGKGFEVRMSSYMSNKDAWEKLGDAMGAKLVDFQKGSINIGLYESVQLNESKQQRPVNRWLELKNDDTMHPHKKMAMGLKELKHQLAETEKFFNWYNKIKNINELDSDKYWKRTNNHIYKIKERLVNIAKTLKEIEK